MNYQLIFLGAPGSGKGTQAKLFSKDKGFFHISTGDLLRDEVKKGGDLAEKINAILKEGKLVTDDIVIDLLKKNCDFTNGQYIFDGFPRNIEQTLTLHKNLLKDVRYVAFYFEVKENKLIERLESRRVCPDCGSIYNLLTMPTKMSNICDKCGGKNLLQREDDKGEVIKKRLEVFNQTMGEVLNYYKEKKTLVTIDATDDIAIIFQKICSHIDN